jgi:hypothetical protein
MCHNKKTFLSCLPSLFCRSKLHNLLLPSLHVPELGAVCHSDGLLHLLNFVFLASGTFCSEHFLPNFQALSYGTPGETELEGLLTAGSCCTGGNCSQGRPTESRHIIFSTISNFFSGTHSWNSSGLLCPPLPS